MIRFKDMPGLVKVTKNRNSGSCCLKMFLAFVPNPFFVIAHTIKRTVQYFYDSNKIYNWLCSERFLLRKRNAKDCTHNIITQSQIMARWTVGFLVYQEQFIAGNASQLQQERIKWKVTVKT